jgi:uncharacterized protein (UPF0548 family)
MARWHFLGGWSETALRTYLDEVSHRRPNFDAEPGEMTRANGWTVDGCQALIGREPPGPPLADGPFARARSSVVHYDFSDPRIVVGHFDAEAPLLGRPMLLEMKLFGLRFLGGVRVASVSDEADERRTLFGFRYDTLEGHFEQGSEWFRLTKSHATGEVAFEIEAHWRLGSFPTWWARLGFLVLGGVVRALWRRLAVLRMRRLAHEPARGAVAQGGNLAHRGDVTPRRTATGRE